MAYQFDWNSLGEIQLKALLIARNLDTEGSRLDLLNRILENNAEMDREKESGEVPEAAPKISKTYLKYGYEMATCLRTVIIQPFRYDILGAEGIASIFNEARSFTIHKGTNGICAASLCYDSIEAGDSMSRMLKERLRQSGCSVGHPLFPIQSMPGTVRPTENLQMEDGFEKIFDMPKEDILSRLVLVENLPPSANVDEKLNELFPEAIKTISYQYSDHSRGIAVLEFLSVAEADSFLLKWEDSTLQVDGATLVATKYTTRANQWAEQAKGKGKKKKAAQKGRPVDFDRVLTGEERVLLSGAVKAFFEEESVENLDQICGAEKILRYQARNELLGNIVKVLGHDTRRRLRLGETTMPEPEKLLTESTKKLMEKGFKDAHGGTVKAEGKGIPTESGHMTKIKIYEQQRRQADDERKRLETIIHSMEGQLKGTEKKEWETIKGGGVIVKSEVTDQTSVTPAGATAVATKQSKDEQQRLLEQAQQEAQKKNALATMRLIEAKKARGGPAFGGRGRGGAQRGFGARGGAQRGFGARGGAQRGGGTQRGGGPQRGGGAFRGGGPPRDGAQRGRGGTQRGGSRGGFTFGTGTDASNIGSFGAIPPPPIPNFLGNKRKGDHYSNYDGPPSYKKQEMSGRNDPQYLENMASALDDKLRKVQEIQEQTLRTQQELLQRSRPTSGLLGNTPGYVSPYQSGPPPAQPYNSSPY